ncbi:MAG: hypothetical protein EA382_09285 [Spirochaetaceae bacterium]|nr:MAG: hypothetical protein EA382_09285 [Spirochaetaceae bacterium]
MRQTEPDVATLRCPVCFDREIDVLLMHRDERYYCVKCSYRGDADDVRTRHRHSRSKFVNRTRRIDLGGIETL